MWSRSGFLRTHLFSMSAIYLHLGTSRPSYQQGCFLLPVSVDKVSPQDINLRGPGPQQSGHSDLEPLDWSSREWFWLFTDIPGGPRSLLSCLGQAVPASCLPVSFGGACLSGMLSHPVFLNRCKCWVLASVPSKCRCQGDSMCTGNLLQEVLPLPKSSSTAQGPTWGPAQNPPQSGPPETWRWGSLPTGPSSCGFARMIEKPP